MEDNLTGNTNNLNSFEIVLEQEILCLCLFDKNSKIAIGMTNGKLSIYSSDFKTKYLTLEHQQTLYITTLLNSSLNIDNIIILLCCSYSSHINLLSLKIENDNSIKYISLKQIEPNESRGEISKAIELSNEDKNIVSIDDHSIIIYKLLSDKNYYEIKQIFVDGVNDIIDLKNNMFAVSQKNYGIIKIYECDNYNLIKEIKNIETNGSNNYMNLLNENILFIGGFEFISLISINNFQLNTKIELIKTKERVTCCCLGENNKCLVVGTKHKSKELDKFLFDIVIYKLNKENILEEIKRYDNAHNNIINFVVCVNGKIISCSEDKKIKIWNKSE